MIEENINKEKNIEENIEKNIEATEKEASEKAESEAAGNDAMHSEAAQNEASQDEIKNVVKEDSECEKKESGKRAEIKKLKAEVAELNKQIEALNKKNSETLDLYKRLAAEFDNYKKRTAKEMDNRYQDSKCDTVKKILPVLDNFERALKVEVPEECRQFTQGVEMIDAQLKEILTGLGLTEIDALGKEFDPNYHNAVLHTEDDSVGQNVVVEVFEKGYTIGDKVVRYSIVKVAN